MHARSAHQDVNLLYLAFEVTLEVVHLANRELLQASVWEIQQTCIRLCGSMDPAWSFACMRALDPSAQARSSRLACPDTEVWRTGFWTLSQAILGESMHESNDCCLSGDAVAVRSATIGAHAELLVQSRLYDYGQLMSGDEKIQVTLKAPSGMLVPAPIKFADGQYKVSAC